MSEHTSDGVAFRIGHQIDPILPLKMTIFGHAAPPVQSFWPFLATL
jgi:hypothetical protein